MVALLVVVLGGAAVLLGRLVYQNRTLSRAQIKLWTQKEGMRQSIIEQTAALRAERDRFLSIFDGMPECVFVTNEDCEVLYANRAMLEAFGDCVGKQCPATVDEGGRTCDADQTEIIFGGGDIRRLWECSQSGLVFDQFETALCLEQGRRTKLSILRDVTAREKASHALRDNEVELRKQALVFENSTDAIVLTDAQLKVAGWNNSAARVFGYTREEALGLGLECIHPKAESLELLREIRQELKSEGRWQGELPFQAKDGTSGVCETSIVQVQDSSGEPAGTIAIHRDITARILREAEHRELELQVHHSQKLESLGVLAGGLAHDFNNILSTIVGNVDLALGDIPPDSKGRENLYEIQQATKRAAELANQMLAYSGRGEFHVEVLRLNTLVQEAGMFVERTLPARVSLAYELGPDLPCLDGDGTQVKQVIINLLLNAKESLSKDGGSITITTGTRQCDQAYLDNANPAIQAALGNRVEPGEYLFLQVCDTGKGIPRDMMDRIFEPFFTTKFTGRGLGLAAVLGIIRRHKGTLHVESNPGVGTYVRVLLPAGERIAEAQPKATEVRDSAVAEEPVCVVPQARVPRARAGQDRPCVLIVDDEDTVRRVGVRMLARLGYQVIEASDGEQALEILAGDRGSQVDALLLDLTMPRMDGREVFRELKRRGNPVRVVMCSGYSDKLSIQDYMDEGLDGFLPKPFGLVALKEIMEEALSEHLSKTHSKSRR